MADYYLFALCLGFLGLLVMAISGAGSRGGHHHETGVAGGHHTGAHHGHDAGGHADPLHGNAAHHAPHSRTSGLLAFLSPRTLFSMVFGFGAAGMILRNWLSDPVLVLSAVAGAVLFEFAVIRPLWTILFRFGSEPAQTLDGSIMSQATVVTSFDPEGRGIVQVEIGGEVVRILATLCTRDRSPALPVRTGDIVYIEEVDAGRNRCTVSLSRLN